MFALVLLLGFAAGSPGRPDLFARAEVVDPDDVVTVDGLPISRRDILMSVDVSLKGMFKGADRNALTAQALRANLRSKALLAAARRAVREDVTEEARAMNNSYEKQCMDTPATDQGCAALKAFALDYWPSWGAFWEDNLAKAENTVLVQKYLVHTTIWSNGIPIDASLNAPPPPQFPSIGALEDFLLANAYVRRYDPDMKALYENEEYRDYMPPIPRQALR